VSGRTPVSGVGGERQQFDDLFVSVEKKHRIFRRRSDVAPSIRLPIVVGALGAGQVGDLFPRRSPLGPVALQRAVDVQVLERFAPQHVVVNRDGDVVYYSSRTGKYLEAPHGAPTRQLLTMARKGLRLDLRTLFREAVETGRSATRRGISIESDHGGVQLVNLTIEPLSDRGAGEPLYLVLFADQGQHLSGDEAPNKAPSAQDGAAAQMEGELREARDRLQSMIEEYETALEELNPPTRNWSRSTKRCNPLTTSLKLRRKNCNRSMRNYIPSISN
jgi:two-component system, chemotaxis family, CheB/CheR fusion protein